MVLLNLSQEKPDCGNKLCSGFSCQRTKSNLYKELCHYNNFKRVLTVQRLFPLAACSNHCPASTAGVSSIPSKEALLKKQPQTLCKAAYNNSQPVDEYTYHRLLCTADLNPPWVLYWLMRKIWKQISLNGNG